MSDLSSADSNLLQPQILTSSVEIINHLRALIENRSPLELVLNQRQQIYRSYIIALDPDNKRIALDELIPSDGLRHLLDNQDCKIVTHRDGVRIDWSCLPSVQVDTLDSIACYWINLPEQISYHQRRQAFRADTLPEQLLQVHIAGARLKQSIHGRLVDISATGCKVEIKSTQTLLQPGQLYEMFSIDLPGRHITLSAELRHLNKAEAEHITLAGFKFHTLDGQAQRIIERFVYQLQREARRSSDGLF